MPHGRSLAATVKAFKAFSWDEYPEFIKSSLLLLVRMQNSMLSGKAKRCFKYVACIWPAFCHCAHHLRSRQTFSQCEIFWLALFSLMGDTIPWVLEHQLDEWKLSAEMCFGLEGRSGMWWQIKNGDELINMTRSGKWSFEKQMKTSRSIKMHWMRKWDDTEPT